MKKTLAERIAARYSKKKISARGSHLAKLLALRYEIEGAIHSGWPLRTIWDHLSMEGKINCSYDTFRRFIRKQQMPSPSKAAQDRSVLEERNQRDAAERSNTPPPARPKMAGFEYRHIPKEELV
jgi:hypothetical protein